MGLNDIHLLFNLFDYLLHNVMRRPAGNGVFMYPLDGRSRHIQALNVNLQTGKHSCNLVQNTGNVFRMNDNRI